MKTNTTHSTIKRAASILIALALTFITNAAISYAGRDLSLNSDRIPDSVKVAAGDPVPLPPPPAPAQ